MFSTFPGGRPGAGLLLLRAALGISLLSHGVAYLIDGPDLTLIVWATDLFLFLSSALLLIGYLTPLASILAGLCSLSSVLTLLQQPAGGFLATKPAAILATVIAAALVGLGPGAFSLDARLFGRREIVISNPLPPSEL